MPEYTIAADQSRTSYIEIRTRVLELIHQNAMNAMNKWFNSCGLLQLFTKLIYFAQVTRVAKYVFTLRWFISQWCHSLTSPSCRNRGSILRMKEESVWKCTQWCHSTGEAVLNQENQFEWRIGESIWKKIFTMDYSKWSRQKKRN